MESNLKLWVAQSESWHTFIDFRLAEEYIAKYPFIERYDDFYISLIGKLFELLHHPKKNLEDCISIAKGLEIYSLANTKESFRGINCYENMLYAAGLYFLSGYSASAYLLSNLFPLNAYKSDISIFISSFIRRDLSRTNIYVDYLRNYLEHGAIEYITELTNRLDKGVSETFDNDPFSYISFKLAKELIEKFMLDNIWADLLEHNDRKHWQKYVKVNLAKKPPVWDFFPSQRNAIKGGILDANVCVSLQMPTSSGKTALCELLIYDEIIKNPNRKILFLAPYRALAAELKRDLTKGLARLGIKSKAIYGGNIPTQDEKEAIDNVNLLISTPEKLMAFQNMFEGINRQFSVIICDEGHLIDDDNRGLRYELLLSTFKGIPKEGRRFIFLTAIIPNIAEINEWLGGSEDTLVSSEYRPARLSYAFLEQMKNVKKSYQLIVNPTKDFPQKYIVSYFITPDDFKYIKEETGRENTYNYSSQRAKSVAAALKSIRTGTVALFAPSKGARGVSGLSEELMNQVDLGIPIAKDLVKADEGMTEDIREYFGMIFGTDYLLTKLVDYGAAFHHGDLPQNVREVIEDALIDGRLKMILCTNTLAEGVNLPIKTIVVHSARRYDLDRGWVNLRIRDLKNLTGRAGRAGKETEGLIIVANPSDFDIFKKVVDGQEGEAVRGYLFHIIKAITDIITKERLTLSNELLEEQSEPFKRLLDGIDLSIIDLLTEEITSDELEVMINSVIEDTFAFFQCDSKQQETLRSLVGLRGKRIKPYIESGDFRIMKKSGSNIRIFEEVRERIDLEIDIWEKENDPVSEEILNYILEVVLGLATIGYEIEQFNERNSVGLDSKDIIEVISLWVRGKWYWEISDRIDVSVDTVLRLFSSLIGFHIQNAVTNVVRIIEEATEEKGKGIHETLSYLPLYVNFGLGSKLGIDLTDIGFTDRFTIREISHWIESKELQYKKVKELRQFIIKGSKELKPLLKSNTPKISYHKFEQNLGFLRSRNIL